MPDFQRLFRRAVQREKAKPVLESHIPFYEDDPPLFEAIKHLARISDRNIQQQIKFLVRQAINGDTAARDI